MNSEGQPHGPGRSEDDSQVVSPGLCQSNDGTGTASLRWTQAGTEASVDSENSETSRPGTLQSNPGTLGTWAFPGIVQSDLGFQELRIELELMMIVQEQETGRQVLKTREPELNTLDKAKTLQTGEWVETLGLRICGHET